MPPVIDQTAARALAAQWQAGLNFIQAWGAYGKPVPASTVMACSYIANSMKEQLLQFVGLDPDGNPLT